MAKDKLQRRINKYSRQLEQQRMGSLGYSQNALEGVYGNLATNIRGITRTLNDANTRTYERLAMQMQRNAAASARSVSNVAQGMTRQYGGLYGGQVAQQMNVAQSQAQGVAETGKAATQTARGLMRAGNMAMAIQQSGVEEAKAAAEYALAQASIARAKADAEAVAQMQLEYDLQMANRQGTMLDSMFPGLSSVAQTAALYSKEVRSMIPQIMTMVEQANANASDPMSQQQFSVASVAASVAAKMGITTESPEYNLILLIAQQIYANKLWYGQRAAATVEKGGTGKGRSMEISIVTDAIMRAYAGNLQPKDRAQIEKLVASQLGIIYNQEPGGGDVEDANISPLSGNYIGREYGPNEQPPFSPPVQGATKTEITAQFKAAGFSAEESGRWAELYTTLPVGRNATEYPRGDARYYANDAEAKQLDMIGGVAATLYRIGMTPEQIRAHFASLGYGKDALDYFMMRVNEQAKGR